MKTYTIIVDDLKTNDFVRGRISGMIYVLTGQPERDYGWCNVPGDIHWMTKAIATDEQIEAVIDCIKKKYPNAILLVKAKE